MKISLKSKLRKSVEELRVKLGRSDITVLRLESLLVENWISSLCNRIKGGFLAIAYIVTKWIRKPKP